MDWTKLPIINRFDLSDEEKRKSFLKFAAMGAMAVVLIVILLVLESKDESSPSAEEPVAEVKMDLPTGEDRDNLEDKRLSDVISSSTTKSQPGAAELYSSGVTDDDPLTELQGGKDKKASDRDSDGLTFLDGHQDMFPQKESKETKSQESQQPAERAYRPGESPKEQAETERLSREARVRQMMIERGYDPETGQKTGYQQESQETREEPAAETPSETPDTETPAMPKVQVRRSGGVSSLGGIGTGTGTAVSSLDSQDLFVTDDPAHPFKVKFAYDEKVTSGQRVTLRLCEDMTVDGVLIPANTHFFAICSVGERLQLKVSNININGRIYALDYEAYDNDGAVGLYCPQTSGKQAKREARQAAQSLGQSALSTVLSGYASTVVSAGASIVQSNSGEQKVNVTAGYSFYLMKSQAVQKN